LISAWVDLVV
jgi:hypothetical protein